MRPVLFDTSIYIAALRLRREADAVRGLGRIAGGAAVWLSSVVLEELYAGAAAGSRRVVSRLEHDFNRARRILVPNLTDWTQTGRVLSQLAARYHYERIGKERLTNDALIATSAGRLGITIVTANARDFSKLAEFRPFEWRVEQPQTS